MPAEQNKRPTNQWIQFYWWILLVCSSAIAQNDLSVGYATYIQKKNPSYFGFNNLNKVGVLYNNIKVGQNDQQDTKYVFGSVSFDELNFSLGFDINSFKVSESGLTVNNIKLTYIYKLKLDISTFLLPSISAGFVNSSLKTNNIIFGDQLDALTGFVNTESIDPLADLQGNINYFHLAASFLIHNENYLFGFSLQNLNQPNNSFNKQVINNLPIQYQVLGGYEFNLNPFENNFLPDNTFLFTFASIDFIKNNRSIFTAQELLLGPFWLGINQKLSNFNGGFSLNNFGFSMGMAVENFDFGMFYQLPIKSQKVNASSIFELQVTFNFSKFRRNNRGRYKRLQTDNYF